MKGMKEEYLIAYWAQDNSEEEEKLLTHIYEEYVIVLVKKMNSPEFIHGFSITASKNT